MSSLLKVNHLSCGHENTPLLSDLNFEINAGELICLMGPNGCGKTTLIKTLGGLKDPIKGEVLINGKNIFDYSSKELSRLISFLLTNKISIPEISVFELLVIGRAPHNNFLGRLGTKDLTILQRVMDELGINELAHKKFDELSDGQKQKVLLGRTLVQDTPIIFLDEPTTFLDISKKMQMIKVLKNYCSKYNKAIVFSSHDWDLVLEMANKTWIFKEGDSLLQTTPEDLVLNNKVEYYFGHAAFNFSKDTGLFNEARHFDKKISLSSQTSERLKIKWTQHALEKRGYEVVSEGTRIIQIFDTYWLLDNKRYHSIEELLISL